MAEKREPKAWITVNGKHVPIFDENWIAPEVRTRYSRFINDKSYDKHLDSDELTWVETMRKEEELKKNQQIQQNEQEAQHKNEEEKQEKLKPWSEAEARRSKEMSKYVNDKLRAGDGGFGEYYEENHLEDLASYTFKRDVANVEDTVTVSKMNMIYAQNWDENDRRVKQGKAVTGSTYYVVQNMDGSIDETHFAYKKKEDAIHAMKLWIKEEEQRRKKWLERKKNGVNT